MAEVTLESLAARVAELEGSRCETESAKKDWRKLIGLFAESELFPEVVADMEARREADRAAARAEADRTKVATRGEK